MKDYDIVIIGVGYNGFIVVCYLVKVGFFVGVFERNKEVGGVVVMCEGLFGFIYFEGLYVLMGFSFVVMCEFDFFQYGLDIILFFG